MKLHILLICLLLTLTNLVGEAFGQNQDSLLKQDLVELSSLIDQEPAFSFRNGMQTKLFFKEELKQAISLSEENKPAEIKIIIHRLLIEIEGRFLITNPFFKKDVRRRLMEILTRITPEPAK